jgi:DNA-binding transcriptional ArsR family regulator
LAPRRSAREHHGDEEAEHAERQKTELARPLAMSLSAVVQHLRVLEASGVVRTEKVGRVRTCRIEPEALRAAEEWIAGRRAWWERRFDRLGDLLAEEHAAQGSER